MQKAKRSGTRTSTRSIAPSCKRLYDVGTPGLYEPKALIVKGMKSSPVIRYPIHTKNMLIDFLVGIFAPDNNAL